MVLAKQTIITKNPGFLMNYGYVAKVLENLKPNAFGFAVQDPTGQTPELSILREKTTPTMADIKEFDAKAKDFLTMLYFGHLDNSTGTDCIQPLVLTDGNDQPFMTLGIEGDFSKFADTSGNTEEYNYATKILLPKLAELCELTDGDLDKIRAKIEADLFNNEFLSNLSHRGSLTILPVDGAPIWLGKNELGGSFDWGQVSQLHGFGEVKQEPVVVEKKANRFSFGGKKAATPPALPQDVATKGDAPRASVPTVVAKTGNTTVVDAKADKNERQPVRPPNWLHKNEDKKTWYTLVAGEVPSKWKQGIPVIPIIDNVPKNDVEFLELQVAAKKGQLAVIKKDPVVAPKTETSAGAPKTGAEIKAIRSEENSPIINAKDMEKLLDLVANFDSQSNTKMGTAEIQALEKKIGGLSTALGLTPMETLNWPVTKLFAIASKDPRAVVLYALEMRSLWRDTLDVKDLVGTGDVVTTTEKLGDNTTKVESVDKSVGVVAAVKKGFSFGPKKKVA